MAIGNHVRPGRGFWSGTSWLNRSTRPHCKGADEQFVNRHRLVPELETQHGSAQSQENFLGSLGFVRRQPRGKENQRGVTGYKFSRILREYSLIRRAPLRVGGALSPYRTSHSVAV
jgi:hypothetical protein